MWNMALATCIVPKSALSSLQEVPCLLALKRFFLYSDIHNHIVSLFFFSLNTVWSNMLKWLMICLAVESLSPSKIWRCLMTTMFHLYTTKHHPLLILRIHHTQIWDSTALPALFLTTQLILPATAHHMAQLADHFIETCYSLLYDLYADQCMWFRVVTQCI